ncbi:hypothetical protein HDU67_004312, partial [Dinochytrium kinnereticum]
MASRTTGSHETTKGIIAPSRPLLALSLLALIIASPAAVRAQDEEPSEPPQDPIPPDSEVVPTITTALEPAPTSTAPPPPVATVRPSDCIQLTTSAACPSFRSGWIHGKSKIGSVAAFDRLVLDTVFGNGTDATGNANVVVASRCSGWDVSKVRYSRAFFCSMYLTVPDVIGGEPGTPNDCNTIASTSLTNPPSLSRGNCEAFASTVKRVLTDTTICPISGLTETARTARTGLSGLADAFCLRAPVAPAPSPSTTSSAPAATATSAVIPGTNIVDMSRDGVENVDCGYGADASRNRTKAFFNAYAYCQTANRTDTCCQYDTNLQAALRAGTPEAFIPNSQSDQTGSICDISFGSFILPCGTLIGFIIGILMMIL